MAEIHFLCYFHGVCALLLVSSSVEDSASLDYGPVVSNLVDKQNIPVASFCGPPARCLSLTKYLSDTYVPILRIIKQGGAADKTSCAFTC